MSTSDVVVAKNSFSATIDGRPRPVGKGETFCAEHPVVVGREELFKPFVVDNDIEQATAAPGEKRRKRPRAKKSDGEEAPVATAAPGEKMAEDGGKSPDDSSTTDSAD